MNPAIVYIYPATAGPEHTEYAVNFVDSYNRFPPGCVHDSIIVLNGAKLTTEIECLFASLQNVKYIERDGAAKDIGGYQEAAARYPGELMCFFGGTTYFKGQGWLVRMAQSYAKHGPTLYGVMGNRGDSRVRVWPHLRTTGFWTTSTMMNSYPHRITRDDQRYEFEHGKTCFCNWIKSQGKKPYVVTWFGEFLEPHWDDIPNGYHRGDQSAMLCGDRLTRPPFYKCI